MKRAWWWLAPVVLAGFARYEPAHVTLGIKALMAAGVVLLVARRPRAALLVLVALLPFQLVLLAAAYRVGLPLAVVRGLGFWKEAVVAGCVAAGLRGLRHQRRPFDAVDALGLVYLGMVGLYYLFPRLFVHPAGPLAIGPPTDTTTLATALRNDAGFVVLLLAVRRLPVDAGFRRRFVKTLLAVGTIVAGLGVLEFVFSNGWNHLMVSTLQVPHYLKSVLKVTTPNPDDLRVYSQVAGRRVLRIGSVFLSQISCGFYLVIGFGIGLERVVRGDKRLGVYLATGAVGVAIALTQTRAALVAVVIVILGTLRLSIERRGPARTRYTFVVVAGLVALIPLTLVTGLAARASGAIGGHEQSGQLHIDRTRAGIKALAAQPLGRGLGTGATNGTRFQVATTLTSEDYYLQVGNETGALSMIVFVALVVVIDRRLRRLPRGPDRPPAGRTDVLVASWRGVFLGLSLAGLFLQVWLDFTVAWTVWAGLGLCLPAPGGPIPDPPLVDLRRPVAAVARHWPLVLATMAAGVLATPQLTARPRHFTAHSTVVVGLRQFLAPPGPADPYLDLTTGLDRQRKIYAAAVTQAPMVLDGLQRSGVTRAPGVVVAESRAAAPSDAQLVEISVTDTDPAVARSLADGLAEALIAGAPVLQQPHLPPLSVALTGPAGRPASPDPDGARGRLAEAAILGLLAGVGLVVLNEYLDVSTVATCPRT